MSTWSNAQTNLPPRPAQRFIAVAEPASLSTPTADMIKPRTDFQKWVQEKQKDKVKDWSRVLSIGEQHRQMRANVDLEHHKLRARQEQIAEELAIAKEHQVFWLQFTSTRVRAFVTYGLVIAALSLFVAYTLFMEESKPHEELESSLIFHSKYGLPDSWSRVKPPPAPELKPLNYGQRVPVRTPKYEEFKAGQRCPQSGLLCEYEAGRVEAVIPPNPHLKYSRSASIVHLTHPAHMLACVWVASDDVTSFVHLAWWSYGSRQWSDPVVLWKHHQNARKKKAHHEELSHLDHPVFFSKDDKMAVVYSSTFKLPPAPPSPPPPRPSPPPHSPPPSWTPPQPPLPPAPRAPAKSPPPFVPSWPPMPHQPAAPGARLKPLTTFAVMAAEDYSLQNLVDDLWKGTVKTTSVPMTWRPPASQEASAGLRVWSAPLEAAPWWTNHGWLVPADVSMADDQGPLIEYSVVRRYDEYIRPIGEYVLTRPEEELYHPALVGVQNGHGRGDPAEGGPKPKLVAFMCSFSSHEGKRRIHRSTSPDGGVRWTAPVPLSIPNYKEPIAVAMLPYEDGEAVVMVFVNHKGPHLGKMGLSWPTNVLSIALSYDDGNTWPFVRDLQENFEGGMAYSEPSITVTLDPNATHAVFLEENEKELGRANLTSAEYLLVKQRSMDDHRVPRVHVTYTAEMRNGKGDVRESVIKYVSMTEQWIRDKWPSGYGTKGQFKGDLHVAHTKHHHTG